MFFIMFIPSFIFYLFGDLYLNFDEIACTPKYIGLVDVKMTCFNLSYVIFSFLLYLNTQLSLSGTTSITKLLIYMSYLFNELE